MFRHLAEEGLEFRFAEDGAGGVIGVVEEDQAGAVVDLGQDGLQVMAHIGGQWHHPVDAALGLGGLGIDQKGRVGGDHLVAGHDQGGGQEDDDLVRAVAKDNLLRRHPELGRQGLGQIVAAAVRVAVQVGQCPGDGLHGLRRGAKRVFVGGHLDGAGDAVLPLQLLKGLAGRIGDEVLNVWRDGELHACPLFKAGRRSLMPRDCSRA